MISKNLALPSKSDNKFIMNNIYEFIGIHLSYYTYMVFTYMRN